MTDAQLTKIEECLWPPGFTRDAWMIVDAARDRRIFSMLLECHLEYVCLYSGPLHPALEMVAPYLLQLDYDDRDSRRFIRNAWGNSWGVFLRSGTSLEKLRRHLREFLIVRGPRGDRLVFRYYDPRVLRVYLPTCNAGELRTLFGPIECFWLEDEKPETALQFRLEQSQLITKKVSVETQSAGQPAFDDQPQMNTD